jgi:subtilisin-like proprotein convertase family protein
LSHINNKSYKLQIDLEDLKRKNASKDLQRKTIVTVQEIVQDIFKNFSEIQLKNRDIYNLTGDWNLNINTGSYEKEFDLKIKEISLYIERIENTKLRQKTRVIVNKMYHINSIRNQSQAIE